MIIKELTKDTPIKLTITIAFGSLVFVGRNIFILTSWKNWVENDLDKITSRQDHIAEKYVMVREDLDYLYNENTNFKISITEINTKLSGIESLLLDIKKKLDS